MKTVLRLFAMLVVAVAATPAYSEESPRQLTLADCEAMLAPVISKHLPQAEITVEASEKLAKDVAPEQAATADKADPLAELDAKIRKNLAGDKWNEASKIFVAALWQDYRAAHTKPPEQATRVVFGKKPDVQGYDDYLGAYGREPAPAQPFLEVVKDEAGGFQVKLEGHTIPAVLIGNTVVFTTGDIVHSGLPSFSEKPYCTLEMFLIIRTEGKFFFGSPSSPPDKWMPLTKHNNP